WDAELSLRDHRGVRYAPLAAIDFEQRDGLPFPGWPLNREALDPWYARASGVCATGPLPAEPVGASVAPADESLTDHLLWYGSSAAFTRRHRDALDDSPHVRVVAPASARRFELRDGLV